MKKLLLTTGLLIFTLFMTAQTIGQKVGETVDKTIDETKKIFKEMQYGVKTGVNISNITGMYKSSSVVGFYAGVYGRYNLDENMVIQPELLISRQGSKLTSLNNKLRETIVNTYLNIPIMFGYHVVKGIHLEAGPQFGFALSKDKFSNYNGNEDLKANTFNFNLAIGLYYNVGRYFDLSNLYLTSRYTIDLTDVYKGIKIASNKKSVFQIGLAYAF
ncbi:MAG: porin family protein [Flavobacteriales bacterium AspAUS03]